MKVIRKSTTITQNRPPHGQKNAALYFSPTSSKKLNEMEYPDGW